MITIRALVAAFSMLFALTVSHAIGQETAKIGVLAPLTGTFAPPGQEIGIGARFYISKMARSPAGRKSCPNCA